MQKDGRGASPPGTGLHTGALQRTARHGHHESSTEDQNRNGCFTFIKCWDCRIKLVLDGAL